MQDAPCAYNFAQTCVQESMYRYNSYKLACARVCYTPNVVKSENWPKGAKSVYGPQGTKREPTQVKTTLSKHVQIL